MHKIFYRRLLAVLFVLSGPVFLMVTDPTTLKLPLILYPFLYTYAVVYISVKSVQNRLMKRWATPRRAKVSAVLLASLTLVVLALSSLGQLTLKDTGIVGALIVIGSFYLYKADYI